ncbi:MAG: carboxypeptidase regulatory-like domain-containing protein [Phycisphaerales bacterium]|nr:carboxypeptidase regulatory-like domain-containing protein [Phycisphaerales bacterium]MCB9857134.1 carboxypeptidase regulatory-like domain-containing protein [Phycisphaerales bacterium]MCB9861739.1 carboxypeptidase regulatory-like domain-containing protein [Phycisphaerales bacterium]
MRFAILSLVLLFASVVACDSKSSSSSGGSNTPSDTTKADAADDGAGSTQAPVFGTSTIKGKVSLEGDPPPKTKITMQGDRFCAKHNMEHIAPKLEVGKDGGLPHVFVYVKKGISAKYPAPSEAVTLDQTGCMYHPHIFGLQIGQTLTIKNNDDTAHNVNSLTKKNQKFNISQPQAGMTADKTFSKEEIMVKFKCDVHGWMDAYCGVLKHPFFAVTDADGNFEIPKLPAGKYTIEAWHEMYGTRTMDVEVGEGETKEVAVHVKRRG